MRTRFLKLDVAILALASLAFPLKVRAEHTRITNPNAVVGEVLGRGLAYSVGFDRVLNDDLVAGIGFGTISLNDINGNSTGGSVGMLPVYVNFYFSREQGSAFATAGATILTGSGANGLQSSVAGLQFNNSPVLPTIGIGYENRGDSGFLFRVAGYGILGKSYSPWFGFTFGYAF